MINESTTREERESMHFNELANEHGQAWWGANTQAAKVRLYRRAELVKKYLDLKPDSRILECGCAAGPFTEILAERLDNRISIYAVDLSKEQIRIASEKIKNENVYFSVDSISDLKFKDGFFDFVVGNAILHHLDIHKALIEIKRVLKISGKLLFFEPNMLNPQIWLSLNVKSLRKYYQASPDETAFYKWQIKKELALNGLKNIIVKPFDFMHPLIPEKFINFAKSIEYIFERSALNQIAGSLIICAEK
jgi:ubiquinone/menaquinone biosynthesis C-methylase UbiE